MTRIYIWVRVKKGLIQINELLQGYMASTYYPESHGEGLADLGFAETLLTYSLICCQNKQLGVRQELMWLENDSS